MVFQDSYLTPLLVCCFAGEETFEAASHLITRGASVNGSTKVSSSIHKVQNMYRSVSLIRPLQKYALPLFFAQVPAQGSLARYNAPLVMVFWIHETSNLHMRNFADRLSDRVVTVDADGTSHLAATLP